MSNSQNFDATYPTWTHTSARASPTPGHPPNSLSLTPIHSTTLSLTLSLSTPSHGGASPSPPPLKPLHLTGASPEDAGDRRRRAAPPRLHLLSWSYELLQASPPSSLPQASSKKDDLKLHQALYTILKPLPVFHSSPVSLSHPRSTPIAIWKP